MADRTITLSAAYARSIPDPVFGKSHNISRHILFVPVRSIPSGIPLDPNPREQKFNKQIYKDLKRSLLEEEGEPGTFHLKHKGITLVADRVQRLDDNGNDYRVTFGAHHGILDGGHSYRLITEECKLEELPEDQYVKFEILTNLPAEWIADVAGGLNTAVQVQPISLYDKKGMFDWLKETLRNQPYIDQIAWRENESCEYDARDIVSLLYCFNVFEFPPDEDRHPVEAYSSKAAALAHFAKHQEDYKKLRFILPDILELHDMIALTARELHNREGGKAAALTIMEHRKRGEFEFPFTGQKSTYRLVNGALLPMMAAFRWMVAADSEGNAIWQGGFDRVRSLWNEVGGELMQATVQANSELGRNPNTLGKSRNHWSNLYKVVGLRDMMSRDRK